MAQERILAAPTCYQLKAFRGQQLFRAIVWRESEETDERRRKQYCSLFRSVDEGWSLVWRDEEGVCVGCPCNILCRNFQTRERMLRDFENGRR